MKYVTKYVTLYRPYKVAELISKAKSKTEGGNFGEAEAKDWDNTLEDCTKQGYEIIDSGIL